jgi:peptidyl-prolyl cis-trans isomerase C
MRPRTLASALFFVITAATSVVATQPLRPDAGRTPAETSRRNTVLARINGSSITVGEFEDLLNEAPAPIRQTYIDPTRRREHLEQLVTTFLLADEARQRGLDRDPQVAQSVRRILGQRVEQVTILNGITPEQVTDAEVRAWYDAHLSDFQQPEFRRVTALFFHDRDAAVRAIENLRRYRGNMLHVRELVQQQSVDEVSKQHDGDLFYFQRTGISTTPDAPRVDASLAVAVFGLQREMDVTAQPVQLSDSRFAVAVLTGIRLALRRPITDIGVVNSIRGFIVRERRIQRRESLMRELRTRHQPEVHEERLNDIHLPPVDLGSVPPFDPSRTPVRDSGSPPSDSHHLSFLAQVSRLSHRFKSLSVLFCLRRSVTTSMPQTVPTKDRPSKNPSARPSRLSARPALIRTAAPGVIRLRRTLHALLQRVRTYRLSDHDNNEQSTQRLETSVRSLLSDVRVLIDDVTAWYSINGTATETNAESIIDLVSLGRMEFNGFLARIGREQAVNWQRIALCDSALQVSMRCLRALDTLIADAENLPRLPDDSAAEMETAVRIRQTYIELYRVTSGSDLPDSETIRARLRASGNCIARVLARDIAASIRIHDQYMMRSFQTRIRGALLGSQNDDKALDDLLKLWQDLTSFTALLLDVSKREELCNHDKQQLAKVLLLTHDVMSTGSCSDEVMTLLRRCEGRDPELDALITANAPVVAIRECTQRILNTFNNRQQRPLDSGSGTWNSVI